MHKHHLYKMLFTAVAGLFGNVLMTGSVTALTYQSTVTPEFTINEVLTITLSTEDITIEEVALGQSATSNTVDITVVTNNASGYTLTSTAGDGSTYTSNSLINSSDTTKTFTSLGTGDSIESPDSFDDSEWGYSFSTDSENTWSNYSGLPYYGNTGATLLDKDTQSDSEGDVVNFRIAAKSSTAQASGTYNNVINFAVTGK